MKRFSWSVPGKALLFVSCVLSVIILASCVAGAAVMLDDGGYFYTHTQEEIKDEFLRDEMRSRGFWCVWYSFQGHPYGDEDMKYDYEVLDHSGRRVDWAGSMEESSGWGYSFTYGRVRDENGDIRDVFYDDGENEFREIWTVNMTLKDPGLKDSAILKLISLLWSLRYAVYLIIVASLFSAGFSFTALMKAAGHVPGTEEISLSPPAKLPFDLVLAFWTAAGLAVIAFIDSAPLRPLEETALLIAASIAGLCAALAVMMGAAVRIKKRTILTGCVTYRLLRLGYVILIKGLNGAKRVFAALIGLLAGIPLVWKTALALLAVCTGELVVIILCRYDTDFLLMMFLAEKLVIVPAVLYIALCMKKVQTAGRALAAGDLGFVTDTGGMIMDLKEHGENLNSIAKGMNIAVEEKLRSERMKTELITNVSHDIKTPLTSIINYASLIGGEKCDNENITKYAEVLVRQSERLKRLIDDLVEASKAATGNLDVKLSECSASLFISQAVGEYDDRFREAELTAVTKLPEEDIKIMADPRRMWRIFDNLMNNIVKYARSGTRVYLSLERVRGSAVFTFRNISREQLDMNGEELMERFSRGDSSRSTEGNGLGLAIAGSMAELMGGELRIFIDGDLFKAVLCFPALG